jgi:uncharacterized membrane protein
MSAAQAIGLIVLLLVLLLGWFGQELAASAGHEHDNRKPHS